MVTTYWGVFRVIASIELGFLLGQNLFIKHYNDLMRLQTCREIQYNYSVCSCSILVTGSRYNVLVLVQTDNQTRIKNDQKNSF